MLVNPAIAEDETAAVSEEVAAIALERLSEDVGVERSARSAGETCRRARIVVVEATPDKGYVVRRGIIHDFGMR